MFEKKCPQCNNEIKSNYDFCPFCSTNLKSEFDDQDYGLLGKNDSVRTREPSILDSFGLGALPIGRILKGAMKELPSMMKMIEKQMAESFNDFEKQNANKNPFSNNLSMKFFINGQKVNPQEFKQKRNQSNQQIQQPKNTISEEKLKKFSKFPRKEPESKMKRISDKIIYELTTPDVENLDDILINQLENSIEIKALGKNKVYSKNLNIKLPLIRYGIDNGKLIIEFQAN